MYPIKDKNLFTGYIRREIKLTIENNQLTELQRRQILQYKIDQLQKGIHQKLEQKKRDLYEINLLTNALKKFDKNSWSRYQKQK